MSNATISMNVEPWNVLIETDIPSDPAAGRRLIDDVLKRLERVDWLQEEIFGVHLALEEALVNAIKHGNGFDISKKVNIVCKITDRLLQIQITDEGCGFDPCDVPDPTRSENLEIPSGRGIMLMRNFMSSVRYNPAGNSVTMEKARANCRS